MVAELVALSRSAPGTMLVGDEPLVLGSLLAAHQEVAGVVLEPLGEAYVTWLRRRSGEGDVIGIALGGRALSALGGSAEGNRLRGWLRGGLPLAREPVSEVASERDSALVSERAAANPGAATRRAVFLHALELTRHAPVLFELVTQARTRRDTAALRTLAQAARRSSHGFPPFVRGELGQELASFVRDRTRESDARTLAADALASWDAETAEQTFLHLAEHYDASSLPALGQLARAVEPTLAEITLGRLLSDAPDDPAALALAEELARLPAGGAQGLPWSGAIRSLASTTAHTSPESALRRRALCTLADLEGPSAQAALRQALTGDPDPSIRSLAARLLHDDPTEPPPAPHRRDPRPRRERP